MGSLFLCVRGWMHAGTQLEYIREQKLLNVK